MRQGWIDGLMEYETRIDSWIDGIRDKDGLTEYETRMDCMMEQSPNKTS